MVESLSGEEKSLVFICHNFDFPHVTLLVDVLNFLAFTEKFRPSDPTCSTACAFRFEKLVGKSIVID